MNAKKIQLVKLTDARDFVDICTTFKCHILLKQHLYIIDGKSLLGIISLDWNEPVFLEVEDGNYEPFNKFIIP